MRMVWSSEAERIQAEDENVSKREDGRCMKPEERTMLIVEEDSADLASELEEIRGVRGGKATHIVKVPVEGEQAPLSFVVKHSDFYG